MPAASTGPSRSRRSAATSGAGIRSRPWASRTSVAAAADSPALAALRRPILPPKPEQLVITGAQLLAALNVSKGAFAAV